jgi:DNA mismatch endonuclease (patch repair protein)
VAEQWVSTEAGRHLAGRRKRDTTPEVLLRKALHAHGARFRLQKQLAKGCTPDIVLPSRRIAVFVDGCFWHGCPVHGRKLPWRGPNSVLWEDKMRRNKVRDQRASKLAESLGWQVFRIWECSVREDPSSQAAQILSGDLPASGHWNTR